MSCSCANGAFGRRTPLWPLVPFSRSISNSRPLGRFSTLTGTDPAVLTLLTLAVRKRECGGGGSSTESIGGPRASRSDRHESDAAMRGGVTCGPPWVNREAGCRQQRAARSPVAWLWASAGGRGHDSRRGALPDQEGRFRPQCQFMMLDGSEHRMVRIVVTGFNRLVGAAGRPGVA